MLLFWRHGYDGVPVAQLATAMGIAPASLYVAFGSKEALYREAVQKYLSLGRLGLEDLEKAASAREGIHAMLRSAAKAFTQPDLPPGCMVGVGALRCSGENRIIEEATAELRRLSAEAVRRRIERARREGELGTGVAPQTLTDFFSAVVEGMSVLACDGASRDRLLRMAEAAMMAWPAVP
jgi:TetR/AcrR family transcriptional regulator, copper-responsive repressor